MFSSFSWRGRVVGGTARREGGKAGTGRREGDRRDKAHRAEGTRDKGRKERERGSVHRGGTGDIAIMNGERRRVNGE